MKVLVVCFLVVCAVVSGVFFATPSTQGQKAQKDEATVVHIGQLTDKERAYSEEFREIYSDFKGRKLSEVSEFGKSKGNEHEASVFIGVPTFPTIGQNIEPTATEFLNNLSCKADVIVIGSIQNRISHLTEDETFIYSEYDFLVGDILKNLSSGEIKVNNNIQVIRPGGLIKLNNQIIRFEDRSYPFLQKGNNYLLFLRYLSSTNGYMPSSFEGDFIIEDNLFRGMSVKGIPNDLKSKQNAQFLIETIKNNGSSDCKNNLSGGK